MLLKMAVLRRIKDGEVSVVFRRWRRPTVTAGGTLKTAVGLLNIERTLKNLGLTVSHDPGYILSPRGRVVLQHLRAPDRRGAGLDGTDRE